MSSETLGVVDKINNKYVEITEDNHIKTYFIDSKEVISDCFDKEHLRKISAVTVTNIKKSNGSNGNKMIVAVGNEDGIVSIWDVNSEKIEGEYKVMNKVTCLKFYKEELIIGTNGDSITIININNQEKRTIKGNKRGVNCIEVVGNRLIVGSSDVKVYDMEELKKVVKQSNHLDMTKGIVGINNTEYITYGNEKNIYLCSNETSIPIQSFTITGNPNKVEAMYVNDNNILIAGLINKGSIDIILFKRNCRKAKPIGTSCRIEINREIDDLVIYSDRIMIIQRMEELRVEYIKIMEEGKLVKDSEIKEISKKIEEGMVGKKNKEKNKEMIKESKEMEVIGVDEQKEEIETTFERKMKVMEQLGTKEPENVTLSKESIVMTLIRGLESNNKILIERCLSIDEENVIKKTINNLPSKYIVELLNIVCDIFNNKPTKAFTMTLWLKAIFEQHLAYLMSIKDVSKSIGKLYVIVESRTLSYKHLLRLYGRMNLLLSQIDKKQQLKQDQRGGTYNESCEEEEKKENLEDFENSIDMDDNLYNSTSGNEEGNEMSEEEIENDDLSL
ncbi:NUC189 domain containing protein [Entamoeba histolytica HM-1:IMSS-B]|uniref:Small-subunit processome Utp12 domain-containing protein n=6 Tax=Entamoeba histolytica TaxID=5759 RepID=C4M2K2_ENTH1|nr:hypothetical protein, conserved [Entamoeba histolytica HM-1:IMSS]EMD44543.1 Hypothetical protein EHI5A_173890 [Entamoeba histolytica KU27]EMH73508.1 NUC189 domain containing protein [Entamoeba histolytica HM-1:IMSS-B]ENY61267.1 hypothetical protein EHI7A_160600 [Entamoeba histolytica HM-1:IMSS-A]GAT95507.1 hypothetical protein conserved [Entamoeba histolytica]EAL44021.1 hypothetical protein, conserved [Entamoeba histolytica HM-1:IMSS]|eukprot:XP_649407.1 hypothetical protein, conserved [Entamoeba histolytica HM-1:IMSS]